MTSLAAAAPPARNRAVDCYRAVAMLAVALGHWAAIAVSTSGDGGITAGNALELAPRMAWTMWLFQVMPLFFVVDGFASAMSLDSHSQRSSLGASDWIAGRMRPMLAPAAMLAVAWLGLMLAGSAVGAGAILAMGAVAAAAPLWFLVCELVLGGLEARRLVVENDELHRDGNLDDTQRIVQSIGARISSPRPASRKALECVLAAADLPRSIIDWRDRDCGTDELEHRQLLQAAPTRPGRMQASHPLLETWIRRLDPGSRADRYRRLRDVDDNADRRALWSARAGDQVDAEASLSAADLVGGEFGVAASLDVLRATPAIDPVRLAMALLQLSGPGTAGARAELESLCDEAEPGVRVAAALESADLKVVAGADPLGALTVLARCATDIEDEVLRSLLLARHASYAIVSHRGADDLPMALQALDVRETPDRVVFDAAVAAAPMLGLSGQVTAAESAIERAATARGGASHSKGWTSFLFAAGAGWLKVMRGDTEGAVALGRSALLDIPEAETIARVGVGNTVAWFDLLSGNVLDAAEVAESTWRPAIAGDVFAFAAPARHQVIWFNALLGRSLPVDVGPVGPDTGAHCPLIFRVMWVAAFEAMTRGPLRRRELPRAPGTAAWLHRRTASDRRVVDAISWWSSCG
jgi:hypothetical protein